MFIRVQTPLRAPRPGIASLLTDTLEFVRGLTDTPVACCSLVLKEFIYSFPHIVLISEIKGLKGLHAAGSSAPYSRTHIKIYKVMSQHGGSADST